MTPVLPISNYCCFASPGNTFVTRKDCFQRKCSILRKCRKKNIHTQRCSIPLSVSGKLFSQFQIDNTVKSRLRTHLVAATGTDLAVEETESPTEEQESVETSEDSSTKLDASPTSARSKRPRPGRKSDMPPVKDEDLIPGATFAGKVRSIQPFGAFVDFGAFTDGLVHVSQLSDSYVKDVNAVVSIGQEVTVRLVEANTETGRISLTMRSSDEGSKSQKQKEAAPYGETSRAPRKSTPPSNQKRSQARKSSKFLKGQEVVGTVKNLTRSGAFISLPDGEEGFLPTSEEAAEGFGNLLGESALQVGQEVRARVLRFNRGQVTLTMKNEEDAAVDSVVRQGVVHTASNPFLVAFRKNKDISSFLDEQEKRKNPTEKLVVELKDVNIEADKVKIPEAVGEIEGQESILPDVSEAIDDIESDEEEPSSETLAPEANTHPVDNITDVSPVIDKAENDEESDLSRKAVDETLLSGSLSGEEVTQTVIDDAAKEDGVHSQAYVSEERLSPTTEIEVEGDQESNGGIPSSSELVEVSVNAESVTKDEEPDLSQKVAGETLSGSLLGEDVTETVTDDDEVEDGVQSQANVREDQLSSSTKIEVELGQESSGSIASSSEPADVGAHAESTTKEGDVSEVVGNQKESTTTNGPEVEALVASIENSSVSAMGEEGPASVEKGEAADLSQQSVSNNVKKEATASASISPTLVKQLREETGAGMMDCKKALSETGGDIVKAQEYLRKKGLASADKKASRSTAQGRIGAYIHDSRIGILIEVNCETDFVARGDIFKELVEDLAMQVAACPQVQYIFTEDVPQELVDKEREIEMQKDDLLSKPEQMRSKIVDGRIKKRLDELALLEQPYIKNDKTVVKDWVKQTIATVGENIKVTRFVRYNLGEGLEKKSQDFAAEVAAQTVAKTPAPGNEQPAVSEAKETVDKPSKATVSAALVKQLREETGAGMMDCKKALSETGGDLEKAQEYLRKKGLASADKKSSRLAAEGRIGSYIHDSRIGVLIEVNSETDFVARSEKFKELGDDLAMQVAACPQVQYVSIEDIPSDIVSKEKELEMQREDLQSKPENIREKIVEGRISKRLGELALLEQPFIKDDSVLVKDLVKQTVAALGENIKVRRFVRFTLGEERDTKKAEE